MKKKILLLIIALLLSCAGSIFFYKAYGNYDELKNRRVVLERRKQAWGLLKSNIENRVNNFSGTVGVVVKDLETNWEIDINKDALMPSASLVKIPIMLSCFYAAQEGKIDLNDVEELFNPMITRSDNAAANALIDFMGLDQLNAYFKKMGLRKTNLARKMLDFRERRRGEENYTSAEDMANLLEELYHKDFLNQRVSGQCLLLLGGQKINDRIPKKLPKDKTFIAHKTGLERHICHDVGIVYTDKGNFLICVLVNHPYKLAKPAKKLISDIALLSYNYYQSF